MIILSLVRSNTKGKIGFLSKDNRLVVGTSRQKCALYIVGNHKFLEKGSPRLWKVCEYTSILNHYIIIQNYRNSHKNSSGYNVYFGTL